MISGVLRIIVQEMIVLQIGLTGKRRKRLCFEGCRVNQWIEDKGLRLRPGALLNRSCKFEIMRKYKALTRNSSKVMDSFDSTLAATAILIMIGVVKNHY